jgi:hypothetical protein
MLDRSLLRHRHNADGEVTICEQSMYFGGAGRLTFSRVVKLRLIMELIDSEVAVMHPKP